MSVLWLLAASGLLAQLEPFDPYVGHCWSAALAKDTVDRHCFSSVFAGKHVRDRHVVTKGGKPVYSGETLYSVEAGQVIFTYWNSLGGIGRGTLMPAGGELRFSLTMRATPDAAPQSVDSVWQRTAAGYDVTSNGETRHFGRDDRRRI